jgi:hypothetical protein
MGNVWVHKAPNSRGIALETDTKGLVDNFGAHIRARLEPRRQEVERAILSRVWAVSAPAPAEDDEYTAALQAAIAAGIDHGLATIERGADRVGPIPAALCAEPRQAARSGIGLDVQLRRYVAGYLLFCDFVMQASEDAPSPGTAPHRLFRTLGLIFDRLLVAAIDEYRHESGEGRRAPLSDHQFKRVQMLLAGERVSADELAYELDDWHVGAVAHGDGMAAALRHAGEAADRRILLVQGDAGAIWAWFAGRERVAVAEIATPLSASTPSDGIVALGEPARGFEGWRLTHQQASAAFAIARRNAGEVVRYADVGLVASISRDRLVASSLRQLYLAPLGSGHDGGTALRETLRAYFTAGRNVSSAAAALRISRQTVGSRLRVVEEKLERTIESCAPELELALRLHKLGGNVGDRSDLPNR